MIKSQYDQEWIMIILNIPPTRNDIGIIAPNVFVSDVKTAK